MRPDVLIALSAKVVYFKSQANDYVPLRFDEVEAIFAHIEELEADILRMQNYCIDADGDKAVAEAKSEERRAALLQLIGPDKFLMSQEWLIRVLSDVPAKVAP